MILFWLLFVGILGLVNCTRSGDIVLTAKYLESGIFYRRRFPWDKITEVWTGNEHIWWVAKPSMERRKGPVRISLIIGADSAKATGSKFPRIWRSNGLKKSARSRSEEKRKQLIRKLRTEYRPPTYFADDPN